MNLTQPTLVMLPLAELYRIQGYDDQKITWTTILASAVGGLMVALAIWQIVIFSLKWYRRPIDSPHRLWQSLLRNHNITQEEKRLLTEVAKSLPQSIPSACLFVDPTLWEHVSLGQASDERMQLRKKIFGN